MTLIEEADRKLQENDFPGARDGYREAMRIVEPSEEALGNLGIAEENEILSFRQVLAQLHPDSVPVRLELARCLSQGRGARKAVQLCGNLLASVSERDENEFRIRRVRLNAAIACGEYGIAAEDFCYLLKTVEGRPSIRRFHYSLATLIARLEDWRASPFIDMLWGKLPKPNPFEEVLMLKAVELAALRRLSDDAG